MSRIQNLEADYAAAWREWESSGDADDWDNAIWPGSAQSRHDTPDGPVLFDGRCGGEPKGSNW